MDRYFEAAASATPPSLATLTSTGYATDGDPIGGTPATKPGAGWFHMITEEIRKVIVDAGLTPDHTSVTQLSAAVSALASTGGRSVIGAWLERMFGGREDKPVTDTAFVIVPGSSIVELDATGLDAFTQEVHCMAGVDSGTGSIRLFDVTAGAQIGGTVTFTNTTPALTKITGLAGLLAHANHDYRLDVHGASAADLPVVYGARLLFK